MPSSDKLTGQVVRYRRAVLRWKFVWNALKARDWDARVPAQFMESDGTPRSALVDSTHALTNVPVEYARYKWGWSQMKTKFAIGFVTMIVLALVSAGIGALFS